MNGLMPRGDPPEGAAGAAAAGGAPEAFAVRLDSGTYPDQTPSPTSPAAFRGYRAKVIDYGEGLAEGAFAFVGVPPASRGVRGLSENRDANDARAERRARTRIRQLVLAGSLDALLTLTYRENMTDFARAAKDLSKFERRVRRRFPQFKFVAVAERQARGAWHWHLAVGGWQDVQFLRTAWRSIVGEGNIDVQAPRLRHDNRKLGLVRYLCKYLSKAFADARDLNRHRFRASRAIRVPVRTVRLEVGSLEDAHERVKAIIDRTAGKVGYSSVHDEYLSGIVFSWT